MPQRWRSVFYFGVRFYIYAVAWLLPFVVIYAFIRPHVGQGYFLQAGACLGLLMMGVCWALRIGRESLQFTPPLWLLILNLFLVMVSVFRSRAPNYSFSMALLPICAGGFLLLLLMQPDRTRLLRRLGVGLCVIGPLLAVYGILQHFGFEILPYSETVQKNKVIATIGHPNYLGSVLGPLLFILMGVILGNPGRVWAWIAPAGVLLILFCLTLARTRAIWLGLVIGFILFCIVGLRYCKFQQLSLRRMTLLVAAGVAQVAALILILIFVVPRISNLNLKERLSSDQEIKSRFFYWNTAIGLGNARPWLGQGYGMFNAKFWETALGIYKSPEGPYYADVLPSISGVMPGHVHNEYLELYCEQGWAGLIGAVTLLLFFLYFGYRALLAQPDPTQGFEILGVWSGLVVSGIDAVFGFPWRLPVSLMILVFILARLYDEFYPQTAPAGWQSGPGNFPRRRLASPAADADIRKEG
jgi:O-antigen ligase